MSLSEMSEFFRKTIKFGIILIVVLIIGKIFWNIFSDYWQKTHTPPPTPPNFALGTNIPPIQFDLKNTSFNKKQVLLETIDGRLPKVPNKLPIYQISKPSLSLLSLDRAQEIANSLGFKNPPQTLTPTEYRWKDETANRNLTLRTTNFSFHLVQDNPNPKRILNFNESDAVSEVLSFLTQRSLLPLELKEGSSSAKLIKISQSGYTASTKKEANAVLVDLYPKPLEDKYTFTSPQAGESLVRTVVTYQKQELEGKAVKNISELKYTFWKVDGEKSGTYPLKTAETVWEEFLNNKSYLSLGEGEVTEVIVKDISLSYFMTEDYQEYLQPIYVFSGKAKKTKSSKKEDFVSYLPAISLVTPLNK